MSYHSGLFFLSLLSLSCVWLHGLQYTGLLCPPLSPGVCSNSCPLSRIVLCVDIILNSGIRFLKLIYLFLFFLEDNYFTILWWLLPCIVMSRQQAYMRPLHPKPSSHLPLHPIPPGCHGTPALDALRRDHFQVLNMFHKFGVSWHSKGLWSHVYKCRV